MSALIVLEFPVQNGVQEADGPDGFDSLPNLDADAFAADARVAGNTAEVWDRDTRARPYSPLTRCTSAMSLQRARTTSHRHGSSRPYGGARAATIAPRPMSLSRSPST